VLESPAILSFLSLVSPLVMRGYYCLAASYNVGPLNGQIELTPNTIVLGHMVVFYQRRHSDLHERSHDVSSTTHGNAPASCPTPFISVQVNTQTLCLPLFGNHASSYTCNSNNLELQPRVPQAVPFTFSLHVCFASNSYCDGLGTTLHQRVNHHTYLTLHRASLTR
jgi:hypothetical protein